MGRDEALLEAFAAELKARRSNMRLSQEELAYRADINRTYIAKLELARNQPTLCVLNSLALALNCNLPTLFESVLYRYEYCASLHPASDGVDLANLAQSASV